jgi:hypothetical protein
MEIAQQSKNNSYSIYTKLCFHNLDCFAVMKNALAFQFDYSLHDKGTAAFHFKNGTIVHAKNIGIAKELMQKTLNDYNGDYWATEVEDNIWEVQYSMAAFSAVYVTIYSYSAKESAMNGLKIIENDIKTMEVIKVL